MAGQPTIVPYLSYEDGHAAIAFLRDAFGFDVIQAHHDDEGRLLHAEMCFGDGVVMIGTAKAGKGSPGIYVVVDDVKAHHARARDAGAEIVYPPERTDWGTWRYRCADPEGHEWSFGSYQPRTEAPSWA
ncbi:MAG: VOC family protein [Roseitalea porphyridii]|uniref:VOC family protein n=1 Tax=Roseitalea porphyridii TaxID=1852022 RepID=UPI0032D8B4C9